VTGSIVPIVRATAGQRWSRPSDRAGCAGARGGWATWPGDSGDHPRTFDSVEL